MGNSHPKSIDGLMRYLRDNKGIAISGSIQKRRLMNIGYYHGFKGYRYIGTPSNSITYIKFEELDAVYSFDAHLKSLFYPQVMFIETALKNYVLDTIVLETNSESFIDIYNLLLDNYKMFSLSGRTFSSPKDRQKAEDKFKYELKHRLDLRNRIYKVQTDAYGNGNKIADHYLRKDANLPIWAIFELLSLGEFGHFVSCLNQGCRTNISKKIGIRQSDDSNAMMPQRLIYATKDLRNAIAHNDVVFDCRFKSGKINKQVKNAIANATGVTGLTFETITDYLVLVIYQLKLFKVTKTEMKQVISRFESVAELLRGSVPVSLFNRIIYTDNNSKIAQLKRFVSQ
jgi:abortive infection bacteriophage resistance protein